MGIEPRCSDECWLVRSNIKRATRCFNPEILGNSIKHNQWRHRCGRLGTFYLISFNYPTLNAGGVVCEPVEGFLFPQQIIFFLLLGVAAAKSCLSERSPDGENHDKGRKITLLGEVREREEVLE